MRCAGGSRASRAGQGTHPAEGLTAGARVSYPDLQLCVASVAPQLAEGDVGFAICAADGRGGGRGGRARGGAHTRSPAGLVGHALPAVRTEQLPARLCNTRPAPSHTDWTATHSKDTHTHTHCYLFCVHRHTEILPNLHIALSFLYLEAYILI